MGEIELEELVIKTEPVIDLDSDFEGWYADTALSTQEVISLIEADLFYS